jgi:microsomal dipeptidase-like Zn-dependent dipeptidase
MRSKISIGLVLLVGLVGRVAAAAPPGNPTGLAPDTSIPGQVTLIWTAATGATGYRIYRQPDPLIEFLTFPTPSHWQFIAPVAPVATVTTGTTYVDTGLPTLVRQFYVVTALNDDGESSVAFGPAFAQARVTAPPDAPVFGVADFHSHQFANLGFGGELVWGQAFSSGGVAAALPWCNVVHGLGGVGDIVGNSLRSGFPFSGHPVGGYPLFDAWPNWNDYTHQQMYADWVKRAYDGGLRLMVVHTVNNRVLCAVNGGVDYGCDDMRTVDQQIQAAKDMEAFVDAQAGGPGRGWYHIAYSASQARHIINAGGLAVVLGMEVDEPFGCSVGGDCTSASVQQKLDQYYARGVRHFFPLHVFDNAFGGAAMYEPLFDWGNEIIAGSFFTPRDCSGEGYLFKTEQSSPLMTILGFLFGTGTPPTTTFRADCNARGLTPLGESLVRGLMRRKMVIDVDHMSASTANRVLTIANGQHYPVVAGHTGIIDASLGGKRHEGNKTADQLARIAASGGLVAPILHQGRNDEVQYPPAAAFNDCSNSSKTWAQAYMAAVDAMGGPKAAAVGFGSDFNGLAGEPGPRFGSEACMGNAGGVVPPQDPKLAYPFYVEPPPGTAPGAAGHLGRMFLADHKHRDENGTESFGYDYNYEGLAHAGLLPDFFADLRSVLPPGYLQPLFRSAEGYLRMWQAAESAQVFPPAVAMATVPATPASGWFTGDVQVTMTGTAHDADSPVRAIRYSATGAEEIGETSVPGAQASVVIASEGTTTVTAVAEDAFAVPSAPATATLRIDRTGPSAVCTLPDGRWHADNVTLDCTATDALSGLGDPADASFALSTDVAAGVETADASTDSRPLLDRAGNTTTAGPFTGNRIDRKVPTINITTPAGGAYAVNQVVAASYACADGGSGVATCAGSVPPGGPLDTAAPGTKTFTVDATDIAGNAARTSATYDVGYNVCLLYDPTRAKKLGSTVPVKLQICDAAGANYSRPDVPVTATGVRLVSTTTTGLLDDSGNANPDSDFRYDASLGGYIFNVTTAGLTAGTWEVRFRIGGAPGEHGARFQLR